jgi:nucleotide-binding universal stress UspA family protein
MTPYDEHCGNQATKIFRAGPIVVDVDGTPSGRNAVAWAVAEAACRGVRVRVWPGRDPGRLIADAQDASMIVVGSAGMLTMSSLAGGSAAMAVAGHAKVPVVVVRPGLPDAEPGPSAFRVVVGTDGTAISKAAVEFAFAEAQAHGCGVTIVHAIDDENQRADAEAMLASLAVGHRDVRTVIAPAVASRALIDESAGARMVVVGSRGQGGLAGLLRGSVSQAVIHRAHCPVAVVRG